jgi:RHS repeat-associated protein
MQLVGRSFTAGNAYRYGFNGKENDNDVKGEQNAIDYGNRIYDPRIGRWISADPLSGKYGSVTPYNFCMNSPLVFIDVDGRDILLSPSVTEEAWLVFKSIVEKQFNGLVTLDKELVIRTAAKYGTTPVLKNPDESYSKVTWTINEEKLNNLATQQAGIDASPAKIEAAKANILSKLKGDVRYQIMDNCIRGSAYGLIDLSN